MSASIVETSVRAAASYKRWLPDVRLGLQNLLAHRLRSLLTMLGMIFGVAAVVSMLSIGAGARQRVMALIEQMGVRNLIVEAKEITDFRVYRQLRRISPGLTLQDYRVLQDNVADVSASSPRKRFVPSKTIPKSQQQIPVVYGVNPSFVRIAALRMQEGRFFDQSEEDAAVPVCVLGSGTTANLFGASSPLGHYVKVDDQWFRVIGVVAPELSSQKAEIAGIPQQDLNNLIYVSLNSALLRLENASSFMRDEIDGIYFALDDGDSVVRGAQVLRAVLNSSHHGAKDFGIIVPAELLAEQKRTERLFSAVMVAIASISLLVGGIGIMNIMLASILERTREIGLRRAVGARQGDIVRQFVVEAVMISFLGGILGITFGFAMSRVIAWLAGWSTIVTVSSILLAFVVSISVGLIFGIYPAVKAARLDPVEAIRYE